jgi:HPt (histidine-containing phosphotransfer) domain-containing protein
MVATDDPWFDEETFAALRETVSEEVFERLLGLVLENTQAKFDEIVSALDPVADAEAVALALHSLKGSALMVGARELEATAEKLRVAARRGDSETIQEGVGELRQALARMRERIRSELED